MGLHPAHDPQQPAGNGPPGDHTAICSGDLPASLGKSGNVIFEGNGATWSGRWRWRFRRW